MSDSVFLKSRILQKRNLVSSFFLNYMSTGVLSKIVIGALLLAWLSACGLGVSLDTSIDRAQSRTLADSIANNLLKQRVDSQILEKAFRDSVTEADLDSVVAQMVQAYGTPMEFQFKEEEVGSKLYDDGSQKRMRKFWYAAKTSKHDMGSHFLIVEVVPDEKRLAVSSFAIVNFPLGIPETLK